MKSISIPLVGYCRKARLSKVKFKLTKSERSWILYDVGNSAFTRVCQINCVIHRRIFDTSFFV